MDRPLSKRLLLPPLTLASPRRELYLTFVAPVLAVVMFWMTAAHGQDHAAPGKRAAKAKVHEVHMQNNKFVPPSLTIAVGDTVRWINDVSREHTATRRDPVEGFDSGYLGKGGTYEHTFTTASSSTGFAYFCVPHATEMKGTVIVASQSPEGQAFQAKVNPGSEDGAIEYYIRAAGELNMPDPGPIGHDLQLMLTYLGYSKREDGTTKGLTADDLERLPSESLMDFDVLKTEVSNVPEFLEYFSAAPAPGDTIRTIKATRFFAPKITDVSGSQNPPAFGWRKLVRLKARDRSLAKGKGVEAAFVLFNVFAADLTKNPFQSRSGQNQVIVVMASGFDPLKNDPAYWFVYDALPAGRLLLFLTATFDFRDPKIVPQGRYYVPRACADCHGGGGQVIGKVERFNRIKLNMLDTDHWQDRTLNADDFAAVGRSAHGVVFDGGKVHGNLKFDQAFSAIRDLNTEILAQNKVVDPKETTFQVRALKTWLGLHAANTNFISAVDRPITVGTSVVWDKTQPVDRELLPLLNRFCYRCHSSLRYHVFDKEMVLDNRADMIKKILEPSIADSMPQDRLLSPEFYPGVKDRLVKLLQDLRK